MSTTGNSPAQTVDELMRELLVAADADLRSTLEEQSRVLRELQLESDQFSATQFLESEARRALGI